MQVVFWGTYDTGKPRVRILMRGLRENGVDVIECHKDVWSGIEDKSQIKGPLRKLGFLFRWLLAYPALLWRYLKLPRHDAVIVGYLGQLDVLVLWPLARLRGIPVVWDAFLSLYDTVVDDRKMVSPRHPLAGLLWAWEWLACRCADRILLDTTAHGQYFIAKFNLPPTKVKRVFVGAETDLFAPRQDFRRDPAQPFTVLFYGQFIPLHGIETVVRAAKLTESSRIRWVIVGTGQEAERIRRLVEELEIPNLEWIEWIPYAQLIDWLHRADLCLGIFGTSDKAARVIPNKVFQILAAERPLVTADTPGIREMLRNDQGCTLIPVCDQNALAAAVIDASARPEIAPTSYRNEVTARAVTRPLVDLLNDLTHVPA